MDRCQAVLVKKFGGYDCISVEEVELDPLEDNIEVEVEYAGLNFADLYTRKGLIPRTLPFVLGMECSGTITKIGCKDNTEFKIGQKVVCYDYNGGMYRERIRVSPKNCFPLPDYISCKDGAAMFVNYLTAYVSVIKVGNLKPKESILILSCTGGVGTAAVQIAKTVENTTVVGTGSAYKEEHAKSNGVDVFYTHDVLNNLEQLGKFDVILSNQSGKMFHLLQTLLKPLGRIVLLGINEIINDEHKFSIWNLLSTWWNTPKLSMTELLINNRIVSGIHLGILAQTDRQKVLEILEDIYRLHQENKIKPLINSVEPMSNIVEATKLLAERKNVGKVLIKMK